MYWYLCYIQVQDSEIYLPKKDGFILLKISTNIFC